MKSQFKCPLCEKILEYIPGTQINPIDGITIYCPNMECTAYENVFGHGRNEKEAFEIACHKYRKIDL